MDRRGAGAAAVAHARTFRHATMVPPVASMGSDTMMRVSGANCARGIIKTRNAVVNHSAISSATSACPSATLPVHYPTDLPAGPGVILFYP